MNELTKLTGVSVPVAMAPSLPSAGPVESIFIKMQGKRDEKVMRVLTTRNEVAAALITSKAAVNLAEVKYRDSQFALAEQPERLANQLAITRMQRADQLRAAQHTLQINEKTRKAEVLRANTLLVDAQQQLDAQERYGAKGYALTWEKRLTEMLDVQLDVEERKELLREVKRRKHKQPVQHADSEFEQALLAYREMLAAHGLDTSKIDELLEGKRK